MTPAHPALVALGIFVLYVLIVALLWRVTGTRYDHLVDSRAHLLRGIVLPIGVAGLVLAVATTWLGWWPEALWPGDRVGPTWALVVPALFIAVAAVNIATIDFRAPSARLVPWILVGTLLVGFAEELGSRGILVVGFRQDGLSEAWVWLLSTIAFSLLHAINALFGQSVRVTAGQLGTTFIAGTGLYVTLMTTGSLVVAMLVHAAWDLGTFGVLATGRTMRPAGMALTGLAFISAAVAVGFVIAAA